MTVAFVLSGGGSLGAVQVGMLQALTEHDIHPDLLVGTSAGAINAAYLAGLGTTRDSVEALGNIWRGLHRSRIFPLDPFRLAFAFAGRSASLCPNDGLARLVRSHLTYERLEDAATPVHLVATDVLSGQEVVLSSGDALSAVLASAAIPGVYPPVAREGRSLVDGGVSDNTAVSQAVALGADEVYVLPAGFACDLKRPPGSALGMAMHALTLLIEQRLIEDVARYSGSATINVLPPLCPLAVASIDFSHAAELIDRAAEASRRWIGDGGFALPDAERFLSLHDHRHDP